MPSRLSWSALVEKFYEIDAGFQKEIRRDISREERQQLASLLERLGSNVDAILQTPDPQTQPSASRADGPSAISGDA